MDVSHFFVIFVLKDAGAFIANKNIFFIVNRYVCLGTECLELVEAGAAKHGCDVVFSSKRDGFVKFAVTLCESDFGSCCCV